VNKGVNDGAEPPQPVLRILRDLFLHPVDMVVRRWNWKSAYLSSIIRALIFFCANLAAGPRAAVAALLTELTFRGVASGFYGAITEAFRYAEPEWAAALVAMILLPIAGHSAEFLVHFLRGTVKLKAGMIASVSFTAVSTAFNLYAMRQGALITGEGQQSLGNDMKRMPRLIIGFLAWAPVGIWRVLSRRIAAISRQPLFTHPVSETDSE